MGNRDNYKWMAPDRYEILKNNARENRKYQTDTEGLLWHYIRRNSLGHRFRRQFVIGDYIADFVCLRKKLIIEVDGGYHTTEEQQQKDKVRSEWLYKQGFFVLRFTDTQIINEIDFVLSRIKELLNAIE